MEPTKEDILKNRKILNGEFIRNQIGKTCNLRRRTRREEEGKSSKKSWKILYPSKNGN